MLKTIEKEKRGQMLIKVLKLNKNRNFKGTYSTVWGNKTPFEIYETTLRIIKEGK